MKVIRNFIYIFTLLFLVNVSAQQLQGASRNIAWVHGLGDNQSAWQHYEQIFSQERNINSMRKSHISKYGINYMANNITNNMDYHYGYSQAHNSQNIGIGHSMGGLAIRDADRLHSNANNKYFGGYITVSTPNYGAGIANSLLNGSLESAADDACDKLTAGPQASLAGSVISIIANATNLDMCSLFIDNTVSSKIANYANQPAVQDLKRGSTTINSINNYTNNNNHNIPRISIYAEENSPVHWRLINSTGAVNFNVLNAASTARDIYQGYFVWNRIKAIACGVGGFWNPWCWAGAAAFWYKANQWKKGRNWFDNSETIWNGLIQTTQLESHTYYEEVWVPCTYPPLTPSFNGRNIDPNCGGHWEWQYVTRSVAVNYPSDGFIPKYSQIMKNNPTPNSIYRVNKANHIEVLDMTHDGNNVDETKQVLDDVFDRNDFFKTN